MRMVDEFNYRVAIVSPLTLQLSKPFFKASMPHRGRILRFGAHRRGPVIRDWRGLY